MSLNGNAYQLDEAAYTRLAAYLDGATRALAGNPDSAEIIADLEQAVVISFVENGTVLGIALPHDMPWWLGLVLLIGLYQCVAWPIHHVRRPMQASAGYYAPWAAAWNGVIAAAVIFAVFWYGIHHQGEVRSLLEQFWQWWQNITARHVAIES